MAREMNLDKREDTLNNIADRVRAYSERAEALAAELEEAAKTKGDQGQHAKRLKKSAEKLAAALDKVYQTHTV
jgi:hypothetical protein